MLQRFQPTKREMQENSPMWGWELSGAVPALPFSPALSWAGLHPYKGFTQGQESLSGSAQGLSQVPPPNTSLLPLAFPNSPAAALWFSKICWSITAVW